VIEEGRGEREWRRRTGSVSSAAFAQNAAGSSALDRGLVGGCALAGQIGGTAGCGRADGRSNARLSTCWDRGLLSSGHGGDGSEGQEGE
jgi:hypothetical protein